MPESIDDATVGREEEDVRDRCDGPLFSEVGMLVEVDGEELDVIEQLLHPRVCESVCFQLLAGPAPRRFEGDDDEAVGGGGASEGLSDLGGDRTI